MAVTGLLTSPSVMAQTMLSVNGASGTNTYSLAQSTTGGLAINQVFAVEYLVVGSGGGGGLYGGGGGGGGYVSGSSSFMSESYSVTVGGGGSAGVAGQSSVFGTMVANGGGAGGAAGQSGGAGASGGGGGVGTTFGGTTSVLGQGNVGGNSNRPGAGGGGGGAGGPGGAAFSTTAGGGGVGTASSISGTTSSYAGGGGGGAFQDWTAGAGQGGGGNGQRTQAGTAGTASSGGGGGGGGYSSTSGNAYPGGAGGSGIVIGRYQGPVLAGLTTGTTSGTGTITTGSFTGNGSNGTNGQLYQVTSFTIGSSTTSGTFSFNMSGVDLNARLGTTMTGVISGSGGLTYNGPGRLTLAATNTYTGATTVNAGSLLVNGQLAADSAVTVNSGALLGGSGSILGSVTVLAGGTFSPGNSPELLSVGSLSLAGTTLMEIDGVSPRGGTGGYDATDVTGSLTYGGSLLIDFGAGITSALADNTTFDLFNFGSYTSVFSSITTAADGSFYGGLSFASTGGGDKWTATKDSQTLEFTHSTGNLVIVPEPAAISLTGIGVAAAAWALRRRQSG
jgi:hypothetical protein